MAGTALKFFVNKFKMQQDIWKHKIILEANHLALFKMMRKLRLHSKHPYEKNFKIKWDFGTEWRTFAAFKCSRFDQTRRRKAGLVQRSLPA